MSYSENLQNVHQELMDEEGLSISQLPTEIQRRIKGWNLLANRLKSNPDDEKLYRTLSKQTIEIADSIQNFIENDFNEEDDDSDDNGGSDDKGDKKDKSEPKEPKSEPKSEPKEPKEPKTEPRAKSFGNLVMEKRIMEICSLNGGRISIDQLEQIIGEEPDYPEQQVHNIKLRKVFMSSEYRLI